MSFEKGKRRKILNLITNALRARMVLKEVKTQWPASPPSGDSFPAAYVALGNETTEDMTNEERRADLEVVVVLFVKAIEEGVDLLKADIEEDAEEVIMALQFDSNFRAVATRIGVDYRNAGPAALRQYGLDWEVLPPFGAIILTVGVDFAYNVT